ncbi:MAG: hypothetical protein L6R42_004723 [Xanthoria sp. 1 TBL-2021]|nr:MAG: hypothetical protein L6R42_004723 [Xanthoria sp. 1 TBL-2021]
MSTNAPAGISSPKNKPSTFLGRTQRKPMPRSGMSQPEEGGQMETLEPPRRDGSLTSSSRSVQSLASFDFSKLDRLDESINTPGIVRSAASNSSQQDLPALPDEKGFSIQIGSELFKLSGASIMSDAPSYLSAYFIEQLQQSEDRTGAVRTLFIDRDPETFRYIARHLQGYLITPTDGRDFVKLFADAQFYRLPRLQSQLFESEIFVEVGNEHFRVPRDIFSAPGDTPNYFTLGFTIFFTSPGDVFPGLNPRGLLRPPGIHPPRIPNRSPQIFSDILHMLRGYPLTIRNEDHRNQLLKDARYYNLRGLEQKLIPHDINFNLEQRVTEIVIRLQDLKPSQLSAVYDRQSLPGEDHPPKRNPGYVRYARPFISEPHHALILEICASTATEPILLDLTTKRITVFGNTRSRITALFQTIANKLNLPTTVPLGLMMAEGERPEIRGKGPGSTGLSEETIMADISAEACIRIDGKEWVDKELELFDENNAVTVEVQEFAETMADWPYTPLQIDETASMKRALGSPSDDHLAKRRKERADEGKGRIWTVEKSQWRLKLQSRLNEGTYEQEERGMDIVMLAVKIEATSGEKARNTQRRFLS